MLGPILPCIIVAVLITGRKPFLARNQEHQSTDGLIKQLELNKTQLHDT